MEAACFRQYSNLILMVITTSDRWLQQLLLWSKIILIATLLLLTKMEIGILIKRTLNKLTNQLFLTLRNRLTNQIQQRLQHHRLNRSRKVAAVKLINLLEIVQLKVIERDLLLLMQTKPTVTIRHKLVPYRRTQPLI